MTSFATQALTTVWVHACIVRRYNGTENYQDDFDAPETVTGWLSDRAVLVNGDVVAQCSFAFPTGVAYVPDESEVQLPPEFGTRVDGSPRVYRVKSVSVGFGGGLPTPDHQRVWLT